MQNDFKTIKDSVLTNVLWPGLRTFIANIGYGFINATLFKGGPAGPGSYWNYYQQGKTANLGWSPIQNGGWNSLKPQQTPTPAQQMVSLDDYKTIEFKNIEAAQYVFNELVAKIVDKGKAPVRLMFDRCGLSSNDAALDNWGWYDLASGFQITPLANGNYHLNLPEPVNFNVVR